MYRVFDEYGEVAEFDSLERAKRFCGCYEGVLNDADVVVHRGVHLEDWVINRVLGVGPIMLGEEGLPLDADDMDFVTS